MKSNQLKYSGTRNENIISGDSKYKFIQRDHTTKNLNPTTQVISSSKMDEKVNHIQKRQFASKSISNSNTLNTLNKS